MLAFNVDAWSQDWFHAKLALVIALTAYQGWLGVYGKKLAHGERPLSGKAVRMINEIPGGRCRDHRRAGDRPSFLVRFPAIVRAARAD